MQGKSKRILLGMLVSNGDCLMATVLARQIKNDNPGCHLTWAISNLCRPMIDNNPFVDEIWQVELSSKKAGLNEEWKIFKAEALRRKDLGLYDEVYFTQIYPDNVYRYDGTTRGTIYNSYPGKVTVSARPVVQLTSIEEEKVKKFAESNNFSAYDQVILFECSSFSGQSFIDPRWATEVSAGLTEIFPKMLIILSTHESISSPSGRIIIANSLSLRENIALSHYCSLLIGCSSGVTWICTSEKAKRLPMVQFIKRAMGFSFASVVYDHKWWNLPVNNIIETTNPSVDNAIELLKDVIVNGTEMVRSKYHQELRPRFISLLKYSMMFFRKGQFAKGFAVTRQFLKRNYSSRR